MSHHARRVPPDVPPKPARLCLPHAVTFLRQGALGIGETHTEVHGRQLVKRLLELRVVRRLFIELPTYGTLQAAKVEEARQALAMGNKRLAQTLARSVGAYETGANAEPRLGDLVYLALAWNIPVVIADPKSGLGHSDSAVRRRNRATAEVYANETETVRGDGARAVGSLLLFGSDHFRGRESLTELIPGLKWICTSGRRG